MRTFDKKTRELLTLYVLKHFENMDELKQEINTLKQGTDDNIDTLIKIMIEKKELCNFVDMFNIMHETNNDDLTLSEACNMFIKYLIVIIKELYNNKGVK